jgi:CheY-like chemotaxis protein
MSQEPKVLVVDDDLDWREYVLHSLEELGYAAEGVATGEEALQRLGSAPYSVLLLDVNMPEMGGEEVVTRLPAKGPHVVFVTSASAQDVGRMLREGQRYYLPKGATQEQLHLILQSLDA